MNRAIIHAHSDASPDCLVSLASIDEKLTQLGVDTLFLTDHDTIRSLAEYKGTVRLILSEEIRTCEGEILGLFLRETIPAGLTLQQTLNEIKVQGGVSIAPHPFDRLRRHVIRPALLKEYLNQIDAIEVFNARCVFPEDNMTALAFAKKHNKLCSYGSDAHTLSEYGNVVMNNLDCRSAETFIKSLPTATTTASLAPLSVHLATKYVKWKKHHDVP